MRKRVRARLLAAALCLSGAAAPAVGQEAPYLAVFANGQRVEGDELSGWHEHPASPRLDDTALLDVGRPLRWLRDRTLQPWRPADGSAGYIEFVGGDRLIGQVAGVERPDPGGTGQAPLRLRVRLLDPSDLRLRLRRGFARVFDTDVRRVVWGYQPRRPFRPMTLFLGDGKRLRFISMRWTNAGVRVLLGGGVRHVPFSEIAELHLRPGDPWDAYFRELAVLRPDRSSIMFCLETTTGMILTGSTDRFHAISVGNRKSPMNWYHLVQPAWSADPICVPFKTIRTRWHFAAHEVPLTRLVPDRVVQRAVTGYRWRWRRNRNAAGGELIAGGKVAGWGLGVHAHNELVFSLPPFARSFRTRVGLDGSVGRGGCARAMIYLNSTKGKPLYRSKLLVGSAEVCDTGDLSLAGAGADRSLILVADAAHNDRPNGADPLDIRDALDWVGPVLRLDQAQLRVEVARRVWAAMPAWEGWEASVDGRSAVPMGSQWDTTNPRNPRFVSAVATGGRRLTLAARPRITPRQRWLKLRVRQVGEPTSTGRIEVRADGRTMACLPVHHAGLDYPYLVPMEAYQGKQINLQVVYRPGAATEAIDWPALALVDRKTGINWTVLRTVDAVSQNGAELKVQPDGSILAGGGRRRVNRGVDTYVVRVVTDLPRITAIRLEALADPSLGRGGPGRQGGFVLSQFRVSTLPARRKVLRGRYVRVELPRLKQALSLAEIQVFAPPPSDEALLAKLRQARPPGNLVSRRHGIQDIIAILKTPAPKRDVARRTVLRSYLDEISENIARKGKASQSSTMEQFKAEAAINGAVGGRFTHTEEQDQPWWQLDLGAEREIDRIVVWNRIDYGLVARLKDFDVVLLDKDRREVWRRRGISDPPVPAVELFESDARSVALASASASWGDPGGPVDRALSSMGSGWTVASRLGESHAAVFVLAEPIDARRTGLQFKLKHAHEYSIRTIGRFRLLATADRPPRRAEPVPAVVRPFTTYGSEKADPARPPASPYALFEDAGRFEATGSADRSKVTLVSDDRHAGGRAVRIAPGGAYRLALGRVVPIRAKPGEGEFRHIRFAFRKYGGGTVCVALEHLMSHQHPCRYDAGAGTPGGAGACSVWRPELPAEWLVMDRDVFADFGRLDLTALTISCRGGTYAVLDYIYLARTIEDFNRLPPAPSPAQTNQKARRTVVRRVLEKGAPAVVLVRVDGRRGTGVLVGDEGWVLTVGRVVAGARGKVSIRMPDGREVRGKAAGVDRHTDMGLVKITDKGKWPGLKLITRRSIRGDCLYVGFSFAVSLQGGRKPMSYVTKAVGFGWRTVQTDFVVKDVFLGGPLLDHQARVVGVHTGATVPAGPQFSRAYVVSEHWKRLTQGEVWGQWLPGSGPMLGIHIGGTRGGGCLIAYVYPNTPAVASGVRPGDILVKVAGRAVANLQALRRVLDDKNPGDRVVAVIRRGDKTFERKMTLMTPRKLVLPTDPKPRK